MRYRLSSKVHVSWHIAAASAGIVTGISIAKTVIGLDFSSIAWLLTGTGLLLTACLGQRAPLLLIAVIGGGCIGLWRGSIVSEDLALYQRYFGHTVVITGTVSEDTDSNERGQLVLRLNQVAIGSRKLDGTVWATASIKSQVRRSDRVTLTGKVTNGFGSFAASMYGATVTNIQRTRGIDPALDIRDTFASGVTKAISEPQASLGLGYVVGQRRGLPEKMDESLRAAGLTHIVVASGYNLTILVRLARRLFERISKYLSFIASVGMIIGFVAITGVSPSMARAGLVTGLSLIAWYYGRRFHPLFLLPFTMAITVLIQPSYAWGDLGWQLSFAAFAGVMVVAPLVNAYFFEAKPENPLLRIGIETLSATIATLPILLLFFGQYSLVSIAANMAILPLVPLAMLGTFVAGLSGIAMPAAAHIIGMPAETLLGYMVFIAELLGGMPWAIQEFTINTYGLIVAYSGMILACLYMQRTTHYDFRSSSILE